MMKRSTKVIMAGMVMIIIALAIMNIMEFRIVDFYAMLVMMFFLVKYICLMSE